MGLMRPEDLIEWWRVALTQIAEGGDSPFGNGLLRCQMIAKVALELERDDPDEE